MIPSSSGYKMPVHFPLNLNMCIMITLFPLKDGGGGYWCSVTLLHKAVTYMHASINGASSFWMISACCWFLVALAWSMVSFRVIIKALYNQRLQGAESRLLFHHINKLLSSFNFRACYYYFADRIYVGWSSGHGEHLDCSVEGEVTKWEYVNLVAIFGVLFRGFGR